MSKRFAWGIIISTLIIVSSYIYSYGFTVILEKEFIVYDIDSIVICDPSSWDELAWDDVLMKGQDLKIKAVIKPHGDPTKIDTIEVAVKTSKTNTQGIKVTLTETGINTNEFHGSISTSALIPSGNDTVLAEFSSGDNTTDDDSIVFENKYGGNSSNKFRGGGRYPGDEATQIPADSVSYFKSAGIEKLTVDTYTNKKDICLIQNQADMFYISSDGFSADYGASEGSFDAKSHFATPPFTLVYPDTIGSSWNEDVDTIIFACCSVLDINNSSGEIHNPSHSPGKLWWEKRGTATMLCGYCYSAPMEMAPTIIQQWDGTPEGWMNVNKDHQNYWSVVIINDEYWNWKWNPNGGINGNGAWEINKLPKSQW